MEQHRKPLLDEIARKKNVLLLVVASLWVCRLASSSGVLASETSVVAKFFNDLVSGAHFLLDIVLVGVVIFLL